MNQCLARPSATARAGSKHLAIDGALLKSCGQGHQAIEGRPPSSRTKAASLHLRLFTARTNHQRGAGS